MITPSDLGRRIALAVSLITAVACALAADTSPAFAFKGFMDTGGKPLFVLAVDGETSGWIGVGQTFREAKIVDFNRNSSELTIERRGSREVLSLADGQVKSGAITPVMPPPAAGDTLTIVVSDGNLEELKSRLLAAAKGQTKAVRIIAPPNTSSAALKDVVKAAQAAGIQKFSITAKDAYDREQRAKAMKP